MTIVGRNVRQELFSLFLKSVGDDVGFLVACGRIPVRIVSGRTAAVASVRVVVIR